MAKHPTNYLTNDEAIDFLIGYFGILKLMAEIAKRLRTRRDDESHDAADVLDKAILYLEQFAYPIDDVKIIMPKR